MGEGEARVLTYMAKNGGVISRAEALALGMSPATLDRRLADGWFTALSQGLYALPGVTLSERTLLLAATTALAGIASHESAARLHGIDGFDSRVVVVTVPVRRTNRFPDVRVHQTTDLTAEQTTEINGIPVTCPPRTVLDLAAVLPSKRLAAVTDQVVRLGLCSYQRISDVLEELARQGKPGVKRLREVLEPRLGGLYVSESTLETLLLKVIKDAGLPMPNTQYRPTWLRHMNGRVDLAYVEAKVIVEADSLKWHGSPEAFQEDRRRDNLAQLAGWTILRFTWEDVTKRPEYVVATIRAALDRSARS